MCASSAIRQHKFLPLRHGLKYRAPAFALPAILTRSFPLIKIRIIDIKKVKG